MYTEIERRNFGAAKLHFVCDMRKLYCFSTKCPSKSVHNLSNQQSDLWCFSHASIQKWPNITTAFHVYKQITC